MGTFATILMGAALVGPMRCMVERQELPEHLQKSLATWTTIPLRVVVTETPLKAWTTQNIALVWDTPGGSSTVATGSIRYRLNERPLLTLNWDWVNPPEALLGRWHLVTEALKARMVVKLEDFDRLHVDVMSKGTYGVKLGTVDWTLVDPHLVWDGMNKVWTCEGYEPVGLMQLENASWQVTGDVAQFWMGKKRFQASVHEAVVMTPDKSMVYLDEAKVTLDMQSPEVWQTQWTLSHVNVLPHAPWWRASAHAPTVDNPELVTPVRQAWLKDVVDKVTHSVKQEEEKGGGELASSRVTTSSSSPMSTGVSWPPTVVVDPETSEHPTRLTWEGIESALRYMPHPKEPPLRVWVSTLQVNSTLNMAEPVTAKTSAWWDPDWWTRAQACVDEVPSFKVTWSTGEPTSQWTGVWKKETNGWHGQGKGVFTPKSQRFTPGGISALAPALWAGAGYQKLNQSWHGRWQVDPDSGWVALPYAD